MLNRKNNYIYKLVLPTLLVFITFCVRLGFEPILDGNSRFLFFTIPVLLAGWYGGFRSGIYATILSVIVVNYVFIEHTQHILIDAKNFVTLFVFSITGFVISLFSYHIHRESGERERLLDEISDAFLILDRDMNITHANKTAARFAKRSVKQLIGLNLRSDFPQSISDPFIKYYEGKLKKGHPIRFDLMSENGKRWYDTRVIPHRDGVAIYAVDTTDKKLAEKKKDEFLGIVSHELKTPLTSLKAYTQLLERSALELKHARSMHLLSKMDTQINKLTTLINDLLDTTRITTGKLTMDYGEYNICELVEEVIQDVQASTDTHIIEMDLCQNTLVRMDKFRMQQVFINLLTNAIKYSPNASKVKVTSVRRGKYVYVSVKDYGIGIPHEDQERIFDKFFRTINSDGKVINGLGLGLYIACEIIRRHGGKLWVESDGVHGSTFMLKLPYIKILEP